MKKRSFFLLTILFVIVVLLGSVFYWKYLRGIGPAIKPAPQDISQLLDSTKEPSAQNTTDMPLVLSPGFSISIYAKDLGGMPRVVTQDPAGRLLVSIPGQGKVVALPDEDADGKADQVIPVLKGLNKPHGLAVKCEGNAIVRKCKLYVAETHQVSMYDYNEARAKANNKKKIIDLPAGGNHFTRTIMFLPPPDDHKLLVSVGSSCNVCKEKDWRRAKILVVNSDGNDVGVYASGLRNAVFLTTHPETKKVWVTEMGRDWLGDDLPPDEINIIKEGGDYGWPYCFGRKVHDSDFDRSLQKKEFCDNTESSFIDIPAHSASLGLDFIPQDREKGKYGRGETWPREYWDNLLVAYHGSWNRSVPTGYKVVRYKFDQEGNYLGEEDFISGWLTQKGALGRPVDIIALPGGIVYISDDKAGVIYRVSLTQASP